MRATTWAASSSFRLRRVRLRWHDPRMSEQPRVHVDHRRAGGAEREVVAASPVDQIVPAFRAGPCMVGYFIGRHVVGGADILRHLE